MKLLARASVVALVAGCSATTPGSAPVDDAGLDAGSPDAFADADADAGAPDADADAGFTPLFDGTDFANWDRYLGIPNGESTPLGLENDPSGVFSVTMLDGEPAIHISGEVWGALISKQEYANFELRLEYKWGTKTWPPLNSFDSGVMVLSTGALGAVNAGGDALSDPAGSGAFMVSVEYQVASGDIGGLYNLGPIAKTDGPRSVNPEIAGAWNQIDIVVRSNSAQSSLNGSPVMSSTNFQLELPSQPVVPLDHGKIQLQSEGAEIYYRRVAIRAAP